MTGIARQLEVLIGDCFPRDCRETVDVLIDGRAVIDRIITQIDAASDSIEINMFIWRDDMTGNRVCQAILRAADRGIRIRISKDKLGAIFELGEENRQSLFHKTHGLSTAIRQRVINAYSSSWRRTGYRKQQTNGIVERMLNHDCIMIEYQALKRDHSKYVIVDDRIIFFGGLNFEDRAVSSDVLGRMWHDYTLECAGVNFVEEFRQRKLGRPPGDAWFEFLLNDNPGTERFEIKTALIALLNSARKTCHIEMAYLGDKDITRCIIDAVNRGVDVQMIIPAHANIQQALNFRVASQIYRETRGQVGIFLSPDMLHSKMVDVDRTAIILGSANFNVRALTEYAELNARIAGDEPCARQIRETFQRRLEGSKKVLNPSALTYSRIKAGCERVFG